MTCMLLYGITLVYSDTYYVNIYALLFVPLLPFLSFISSDTLAPAHKALLKKQNDLLQILIAKNKTPTKKSPTKRKNSYSGSGGGGGGGGGGTRTKLKLLVIHYTSMVWYGFNTFCIGSVIFT